MGRDTSSIMSGTTKYLIRSRFETNGMCEKSDVVGALFGQTGAWNLTIGVKRRVFWARI
ncbi:MAG: hypothetical protein Q6362_010565 [Candidatus Wukongarchaeota archaeon]|jgi:hypothetical protein|nr:hypothetical protein [Candidatus Wukongarchaeota archaeon]